MTSSGLYFFGRDLESVRKQFLFISAYVTTLSSPFFLRR